MKSFASIIGWLLLTAVLAVPSFIFYNLWTSRKNDDAASQTPVRSVPPAAIFAGAQDKSAAKPSGRTYVVTKGPVFRTAPGKRVFQPAPVRQAVQPAPAAPVSSVPVRQTVQPAPAAPVPSIPARQAAQPAPVSSAVQAGSPLSVPVSTRTGPGSYFKPQSDRDPTITPEDYQRIREEEQKLLENERMQQLAMHKQQRKASTGEDRIKLQGIVGNSVIINGEMYLVGNTVAGVRILKIGSNYFIGEFKGKKFKKIL
jgi:FtsZ-interacting cell division protein ZipA